MSSRLKSWFRNAVLTNEDRDAIDTVRKAKMAARFGLPLRGEEFEPTLLKGIGPEYVYMRAFGIPRLTNDRELRELGATPTPAACINRLINDIRATAWKIVPADPTKGANQDHIDVITEKFLNPNPHAESYETIIAKVVRDILEIDAGVIAKFYAAKGTHKFTQFYARDGSSFLKQLDEIGNLGKQFENQALRVYNKKTRQWQEKSLAMNVAYWQHETYHRMPTPFEQHEVLYFMLSPCTYSVYGQSKVKVLELRLKTLMSSDISTEKYFRRGEIMRALVTAPEPMEDPDWKRWTKRLDDQLKDESKGIIPTDVPADLKPVGLTRRDYQWLEQQEEYRLSVCALFSVTPAMLGWTTRDVAKATDESQRIIYLRKGLWPLLNMIQYKMNMEIVSEFFIETPDHKGPFADETPDVLFTYDLFDPTEYRWWLEASEIVAKSGLRTINEMRAERDLPPVKWGDCNPAAIINIQQFAQSVFMGGLTIEQFCFVTGIPSLGEAERVLAELRAVPPKEGETEKEKETFWTHKWKSYKKSRGL